MTDRAGNLSLRRSDTMMTALVAAASALLVAGCSDVPGAAPDQQPDIAATAVGAAPVRPVTSPPALEPAPEIFSTEAWALWDGRKTLGGRWVALPDVDIARRVRLTDTESGTAIDGALIRRNPDQTGPKLIISSEAAESLKLRPGVATPVMIVALAYPDATPQSANSHVRSQQAGPYDPASQPPRDALASASGAEVDNPVVGAEITSPPTEPEAIPVETAEAETAEEAPLPDSGSPQTPAPQRPQPPAGGATIDVAEVPRQTAKATPEPPAAEPGDAEPAVPAASDGIADGLPFIQAGVFADPANAARLVTRLRAAGLPAGEQPLTTSLTRVVIGPYQSVDARNTALKTVRNIGPADAIPARE